MSNWNGSAEERGSINVMRDMATGRARGFAFIEMATDEQQAISLLNERDFGGRNLTVNVARPKVSSGGFGGGGGRRRSESRW